MLKVKRRWASSTRSVRSTYAIHAASVTDRFRKQGQIQGRVSTINMLHILPVYSAAKMSSSQAAHRGISITRAKSLQLTKKSKSLRLTRRKNQYNWQTSNSLQLTEVKFPTINKSQILYNWQTSNSLQLTIQILYN